MTEAKHTPGPWDIKFDSIRSLTKPKYVAGIITVNNDHDEAKANARLIAAAPELLNALKDMVATFSGYQGMELTAARAAIAKATGG